MAPLPLYLVLQDTLSYKQNALPHVFDIEFDIVKKLCRSDFVSLEYSLLGVLSWVCEHFKWWIFVTYLGASHSPSGVIIPFISINFLHPYSFHSFPFHHLHSLLCSCLCLFPFGHLLHSLLHFVPFKFHNHHHNHHIFVFSFSPLEDKLHTYLTTWLSSCPVGIFFGSLTIIAKIKNHKQSATIKMCNSKINSHQPNTQNWAPWYWWNFEWRML